MPKIIENVREQVIKKTKSQLLKHGYAKTTMRSIAADCGLAVGTVYNYFESKEILIATLIVEEWSKCRLSISKKAKKDPTNCLKYVYEGIMAFVNKHKMVFTDEEARKVFATNNFFYHKMFREQLAEVIMPLLENSQLEDKNFAAEFLMESVINYAIVNEPLEKVNLVVKHFLK